MAISSLKDLYIEEMRDLISANNQMQQIIGELADRASESRLQELLQRSVNGIADHTQTLRKIVDTEVQTQCKGMEGLVAEAKRHAIETELPAQLRDLEIIAQYQRMSHYGLAGFGTAAAYADALGLTNDARQLRSVLSDIFKADEYSSYMAETVQKAASQK